MSNDWRQALREFFIGYTKIHERQSLLNRPWQEEFLHFAPDGSLHGHLTPPIDGQQRSVTADGWCPGLTADRQTSRGSLRSGR